jgi:GNAT superfamily N-acetyltransferase
MTQFRIETYDQNYLERMTALFNAETAFEPHIAPLNPERFVHLVEQKSYFDPGGLFIALEGDQVVGWCHACIAAGSEGWHDPQKKIARIRMLIYPRDRLKVGGALVDEATNWLKQSNQSFFLAMHAQVGYPFYRGLWMGGEPMGLVALPQLQVAFEVGGYKTTQESIFMVREMSSPPVEISPTRAVEFVEAPAEMKHEPMRESWIGFEPRRTRAFSGEEEAGSIGWVIQPYLDRLGAACMNIWGLGVKEPYRRHGIASALISKAMAEGYAQGARFASVGTQLWNGPAHATYAKLGYQPYTILVGRTLYLDDNGGQE